MNIGHYVSIAAGLHGYERNVSGHIQIPLRAAGELAELGHDIHLITNEFDSRDRSLPWCMPNNVTTHYVVDSRRRGLTVEKKQSVGTSKGVYPLTFLRQIYQIKDIVCRNQIEVLHLHGSERTALLAAALYAIGMRVPTVASLIGLPSQERLRFRWAWNRVGPVVAATEFAAQSWRRLDLDVRLVRHWSIRNIRGEEGFEPEAIRNRVLFWRDLTVTNGADVCRDVFDVLAPEFRHIAFDVAVRPNPREITGLEEVVSRHSNVHIHRFPYPNSITLAQLLSQSIVVVLPFRRLSVQPQLAIVESLDAGAAVVTTDLDSNPEIICDGLNGRLVPVGNVKATVDAVRQLLLHPEQASRMGENAASTQARMGLSWNLYAEQLLAIYHEIRRD